ncbi:hypothetical protein REPUB_Repub01dG0188300 [Reevesia pubescens]
MVWKENSVLETTVPDGGIDGESDKGVHSDYYDSDEYENPVSDEDEMVNDATKKKKKIQVYDPTAKSPYIELGMLFKNAA